MTYSKRVGLAAAVVLLLAQPLRLSGQTAPEPIASQAPGAGALTDPGTYLGFPLGADFRLAGWDSITAYLSYLAGASPMMRIDTLGLTTLERPFVVVTISAPGNMARLEEIRRNQAKLADPRRLAPGELDGLVERQPAVVAITHNIHSTEIASSQGGMELAYALVSDEGLSETLEDVVVLLVPSVNPDGQQMVVDWYARTIGTPYEGSGMPWLYHHYVGHDNNRDFYMLTQVESQMVNDLLYATWYPEVVYDVHQMGNRGARLFIPPFGDPVNPNLDPLVVRSISLFGQQVSADLEAAGKAGVVNYSRFDLWWHGGLRTVPARHNMIGILSESASARLASPIFQDPSDFRQQEPSIHYPNPWPGGWWRIRDIIDYQLIAAQSIISLAGRQRAKLIRNYVEMGRRSIKAGTNEPPFAFVIPADQRDPGSAASMLEIIRRGGVEIHTAAAPFEADGVAYKAGDWVILMAQPYRAHAKDLLEPQRYPDRRVFPGGPPITPYDAAGWTLPLQMGVTAVAVATPLAVELRPVTGVIRPPAGTVTGAGPAFVVTNETNAANLAINRTLSGGGQVVLLSETANLGGRSWPEGSAVLSGAGAADIARELAETNGLNSFAVSGTVEGYSVDGLRVGLYQPWTASMDEGWTRWVFETWDMPYQTLHDAEIRAGDLRDRYEVIVIPDLRDSIIQGRRPGTVPPEYAGGLGEVGIAAIRAFVKDGGTLICLNSSSSFAIEHLDTPVADVRPPSNQRRSGEAFYAPGSVMAVTMDPSHPLAYGMPEDGVVYYNNSPVFEVAEDAKNVDVVARYPAAGQLLSGYALNAEFLSGKAALVEAKYGEGRVVLFGFRPQYRAQSHETFKVLFNAIYRGASVGPQQQGF